MKVSIASDHRGWAAKERVKALLAELGHEVIDHGTDNDRSVDYPDFARPAAEAVGRGVSERGILLCGSGIGVSMIANKIPGVRAALCHDELGATMSRRHNDANVLCLPADWLGEELIRRMVQVWMESTFESGRHLRRVEKLKALERELYRDGSGANGCAESPREAGAGAR